MTNLDIRPDEVTCPAAPRSEPELLVPRDVPLGGIRAMTVRRTLPARGRPLIGPWCFADHYGPDLVSETGGMVVPPHPHCGLATVSWLFRGEIEHRDSLGTHELVLPGELNLMTAGRGIAHSEVSTTATTVLHGVQLWVALPAADRAVEPSFRHYAPPAVSESGVTWRVFMGELAGERSPVPWYAPILGAEISLASGAVADIALDPGFEHGVLVDTGPVSMAGGGLSSVGGVPVSMAGGGPSSVGALGRSVDPGVLAALPLGCDRLQLRADAGPARVVLLGGAPYESDLVMWWNFVGGSHDEIVAARGQWQAEIGAGGLPGGEAGGGSGGVVAGSGSGAPGASGSGSGAPGASRFGIVRGYDGLPLPAPALPGGRLKPRRNA